MKFSAVAFDLDGTLYPNYSFYLRVLPFVIREQRCVRAFSAARNRLRREDREENAPPAGAPFYMRQAIYMGETLKKDPALLLDRTKKLIYRGWEPLFKKVKLFPHVKETLSALREKGVKLGLLSDFPPETKLEYLGLSGLWDAVLCSETIGRLKPAPESFLELASSMSVPPGELLYVGNSFPYDVVGAQKAGMKAAWVKPKSVLPWKSKKEKTADFVFFDYRQLYDYVIT